MLLFFLMETETKSYELNYLLKGNLEEVEAQEAEAGLRKLIEDESGLITQESTCQKRNLAYLIKKHDSAHFGSFKFIFPPEKIKSLEKSLKKTDLLRFSLNKIKQANENAKRLVKKKSSRPVIENVGKSEIKPLLPQEEAASKKPLRVEEIDKKLEEILGE